MLPILFGLGSAFGWGAADFAGGLAARKTGAYRAVFYGSIIGLALLVLAAAFIDEPLPDLRVWLFSLLAGALGIVGLLLLYHAMTLGLMSVAAPVSALLAAALPVVVGLFTDGLPKTTTLFGFGFALLAVWMISQSAGGGADIFAHLSDLKIPLLAGVGFGLYFVFIHEATKTGATIYPMLAARFGGLILITTYMLFSRAEWKADSSAWTLIAINGVLDIFANGCFILAIQTGRLDVAAVLSSLFPGVTVMLAWIFLKERLMRNQWLGVAAALVAIVLMTM